ncbi:hypothetical protein cypCar_00039900 [Cyprinus carpio]|nr:hypothetical protein cypCar_00039900 [Cyprinus carpio]
MYACLDQVIVRHGIKPKLAMCLKTLARRPILERKWVALFLPSLQNRRLPLAAPGSGVVSDVGFTLRIVNALRFSIRAAVCIARRQHQRTGLSLNNGCHIGVRKKTWFTFLVGNHVYWHCTIDTSTTCVPCPESTYTDEPNGLTKCFSCTVCDTDQHLKVKKACTRSADTICEPQEGLHCIKLNKESCTLALEHTECKPGQYIKQSGTAFTDTVCAGCIDGTYSNGSLRACLPHSKCETMGLTEIKAGTSSSDAECEKVTSVGLIVGVTIAVLVGVVAVAAAVAAVKLACIRKHKARRSKKRVCRTPQQATEDDESNCNWDFPPLRNRSPASTTKICSEDDTEINNKKQVRSIVLRDCSGDLSTTCKPCTPGTFISEPNGLPKCFTCRNCVESQGLYIQRKCTTIQDTICAVLDGYYCIDFSNLQCSHAQKHSVCKPGQETKTPGTKTSDTVCADCPHGFYSPSGLNCTKWTDCSSRNERETENGSSVKDVTCIPKRRERYGLIFAIVLTPLFYIILYLAPQSTSEYMQDLSEFSFFTQCNQNGLIKVTWIANNLPNAGGFVGDY